MPKKAMKSMKVVQKSFPGPKKGKGRMVKKSLLKTKKCALWKRTPYVRHGRKSTKSRLEHEHWCRSAKELLQATDNQIVRILLKDGFLTDKTGSDCPTTFCHGKLGELRVYKCRSFKGPQHRCSQCDSYFLPHHGHPVFTCHWGQSWVSLQEQSATLFCALAHVKKTSTHLIMGRNHKFVEGIYQRLDQARTNYVESIEKTIKFGEGEDWKDTEADEVDLRKSEVPDAQDTTPKDDSKKAPKKQADKKVAWEQWGGLVERGAPQTLVLTRLNPIKTKPRSPGPGPMRKRDWIPTATKYLTNKKVMLHTDGARAYKMHIPGVIHNNVVHAKKRMKIGGKWVWVLPHYVKLCTHKVDGRELHVKSGTQIIDRAWRFIRTRLEGYSSKVGSATLRRRIRSAQWEYWHMGQDHWAKTGEMLSTTM